MDVNQSTGKWRMKATQQSLKLFLGRSIKLVVSLIKKKKKSSDQYQAWVRRQHHRPTDVKLTRGSTNLHQRTREHTQRTCFGQDRACRVEGTQETKLYHPSV